VGTGKGRGVEGMGIELVLATPPRVRPARLNTRRWELNLPAGVQAGKLILGQPVSNVGRRWRGKTKTGGARSGLWAVTSGRKTR